MKIAYYVCMLAALISLLIAGLYFAAAGLCIGVILGAIDQWRHNRRMNRLSVDLRGLLNARNEREGK
jgi:hypothetical protein